MDNHNWKLRPSKQGKGNNAPLEAWNALRVNGERAVKVIYINGMGISAKAKQMNLYDTPECFARRSFWLPNKPKFMFIHYMDLSQEYQE